jgi:hypothetical protein
MPAVGSDVLSIAKLAHALNWGGADPVRRLRRYLIAKQRRLGVTLLLPIGPSGKPRWGSTMRLLGRHCPELFKRQPRELLPDFRRLARAMTKDLRDTVDERVEAVTSERFTEISEKLSILRQAMLNDRKLMQKLAAALPGIKTD